MYGVYFGVLPLVLTPLGAERSRMTAPQVYARPSTLLLGLGGFLAFAALLSIPAWAIPLGIVSVWWLATPAYPWDTAHSSPCARTAPCAPATTGATAGERKN